MTEREAKYSGVEDSLQSVDEMTLKIESLTSTLIDMLAPVLLNNRIMEACKDHKADPPNKVSALEQRLDSQYERLYSTTNLLQEVIDNCRL